MNLKDKLEQSLKFIKLTKEEIIKLYSDLVINNPDIFSNPDDNLKTINYIFNVKTKDKPTHLLLSSELHLYPNIKEQVQTIMFYIKHYFDENYGIIDYLINDYITPFNHYDVIIDGNSITIVYKYENITMDILLSPMYHIDDNNFVNLNFSMREGFDEDSFNKRIKNFISEKLLEGGSYDCLVNYPYSSIINIIKI